jgi:hypothetical protein
MVDVISGGRLNFGVGRGTPIELEHLDDVGQELFKCHGWPFLVPSPTPMVEVTKVLACLPGLTSAHPIVMRTPPYVLAKKNKGT